MFWTFAVVSMLGYSIMGVLMAKYARNIDPLSAGAYRNLSLFVTLLPLLFFSDISKLSNIGEFLPLLVLSAVLAALAQWARFLSLRIFPVGIHTTLSMGFTVLLAFIWSYFYFGETITFPILFFVLLILLGSGFLSLQKSEFEHLNFSAHKRGLIYIFLTAFFISISFSILVKITREYDPFIAGYFWEVLIGIVSFGFLLIRKITTQKSIEKISLKTFWRILVVSSPTLIGTGAFVLATQIGNLGIVSAIGAGGGVVATIMSWWIYKEKVTKRALVSIFVITGSVMALKFL